MGYSGFALCTGSCLPFHGAESRLLIAENAVSENARKRKKSAPPLRRSARNFPVLLATLMILGAFLAGAGWSQDTVPERLRFIPQWLPQAQFAGYYVAHEKGFYRRLGLEVDILRGGPDRPPSELLARGEAEFGTMFLATAIVRRAGGEPLVNIAQIVQRSAFMLVAKQGRGINSPADLEGKKVGLWGQEFQAQARAFLRQFGLTVQIVPQNDTMTMFLRGGVDAASAMWYNEYHLLLNAGLNPEELTTFALAEYGLNFPEDGLYCLAPLIATRPDVCRRFVQASLDGWEDAFAHPEEALDIVMKYTEAAKLATNRMHQRWMLARMQDIIAPRGGQRPTGVLLESDYLRVAQELKQTDLIERIPSFGEFAHPCLAVK